MTLEELQGYITRGPGLVVGPGATTNLSREATLLERLKTEFPVTSDPTRLSSYLDYTDLLIANDIASEPELRVQIVDFFSEPLACNPQLALLMKANWTAILPTQSRFHCLTTTNA
jgi:hypothetical protein